MSNLSSARTAQPKTGVPNETDTHSARLTGQETSVETVIKLRRQGVRLSKGAIAPAVFWPAIVIVGLSALLSMTQPDLTWSILGSAQQWIVENLGWYYSIIIFIFLLFSIAIGVSKFGRIRLGRDEERPAFGILTWFSMLFAAGMGIGLVFYGVGEPMTFALVDAKPGWEGGQSEVLGLAMAQTFVHWGLHPWSIYAVIGLSVAYAVHRKGRPVSIRWVFEPLLGERVKGRGGDLIDIIAIIGTMFGLATSLGLGVQQIAQGLMSIGIVHSADTWFLISLIVAITIVATASVVSGVTRGMKWLSNINMSMAGVLMVAVLLLGPTVFLFQNFVESFGIYLANLFNMSLETGAYAGSAGTEWATTWTMFYWGWWMSWAPFVGIFIARISRGRTVRQFITGVLLVPTLACMVWFSVMGGAGIYKELFGGGGVLDDDGGIVVERALFDVLGDLPFGLILSIMGILLIIIFFITSADSGALVVNMLTAGGNPEPPKWSRAIFALLSGLLSAGLLVAGGLEALQAGALVTALPFSLLLLGMCFATWRALKSDSDLQEMAEKEADYQRIVEQVTDDVRVESMQRQAGVLAEAQNGRSTRDPSNTGSST
jgi:choline/glycine/proline betaine transport protein